MMNSKHITRDEEIQVWATNTGSYRTVLVFAETKGGQRLSVVWNSEGYGDVAIDELTDEQSDEVWNLVERVYFK